MGCCLIKGIHAEAFAAGQGQVDEGFVATVRPAVMMSKDLSHFGQAVAAAAFDFLGDLQMQRFSPLSRL